MENTEHKEQQTESKSPDNNAKKPESNDLKENLSVLATGLPNWDIEPPMIVARKRSI